MKKIHRLILYFTAFGLGFGLFAAVYFTIAARVKRLDHQVQQHQVAKKGEDMIIDQGFLDDELNGIEEEEQISRLMKAAEEDNNDRLERVETTCKKYGMGIYKGKKESTVDHPPVPQYQVFFIDVDNQLAVCPVYKAGSSSWLYNLCLLAGMTEDEIRMAGEQLSTLAREKYPELEPAAAEEALQTAVKIMTVRHPFERVLAAYRDKLENTNTNHEHGSLYYHKKYGRRIVNKYRDGGNETKVWQILSPSQYIWNPAKPKPSGNEPTFQEFVKYLIDTDLTQSADDHWVPYYLFCTPCLLRYNIIAKVETLGRDQMFAIRLLGLDGVISPVWQRKTQFLSEYLTGNRVSQVARIYFQQLTVNEINQLYEKYRIDFDLFAYNHEDYIQYARDYNKVVQPIKPKEKKKI